MQALKELTDAIQAHPDKEDFLKVVHALIPRHPLGNPILEDHEAVTKAFNGVMVSHIDASQIITAVKAACKVVAFLNTTACPIVNNLAQE